MLLQEMKRGRQLVKRVERKGKIKEPVKEIVELKDRRVQELTWDQSLLLYTVKTSKCSQKQLFRKSDPILYVQ